MLEYEIGLRALDAMNEENQGSLYRRMHAVAERALFGLFDRALAVAEMK